MSAAVAPKTESDHLSTTTNNNSNIENNTHKPSSTPTPTPTPTSTQKETQLLSCPALDAIYGTGSESKVFHTKILVVGAGGVGCELIKNLCTVGFRDVTVIDLDTIDFSNLNRQFLFRRPSVGLAKAIEAAKSIRTMIPDASINGLLANVKDMKFSVDYFKQFHMVCNALDNLDARRHVNRMCLAANIPLIDSGSTGYLGQCEVFGKGFECYDCIEHPTPKSYAVCTIRSTPEKPVHCITWAKLLFELVFGPPDADNVLSDLDGNSAIVDNTHKEKEKEIDIANGQQQQQQQQTNGHDNDKHEQSHAMSDNNDENTSKPTTTTPKRIRFLESDTPESFSRRLCTRVFIDDIEDQRRMESLWTSRAPPSVQDVESLSKSFDQIKNFRDIDTLEQRAWSISESAAIFQSALHHFCTKRRDEIGEIKFDKDDADALLFVTAASNLRSAAYGVPLQSPFSVKGIAGNIVHAVATTNAIVAGLISLEALKLATNGLDVSKAKKTMVSKSVLGSRVCTLLQTDPMRKPNKKCFVCSNGQVKIHVNCEEFTLRALVESVCKKKMAIRDPIVQVCNTSGKGFENTVYECGAGLEDDEIEHYENMLKNTLTQCKVETGTQIIVEDLTQNVKCTLHVKHTTDLLMHLEPEQRFQVEGDVPTVNKENDNGDKKNEKVQKNTVTQNGAAADKKEEGNVDALDDVDEITWVETVDESKPDWGLLEAAKEKQEKMKLEKDTARKEIQNDKSTITDVPISKKRSMDDVVVIVDDDDDDDKGVREAKRARTEEN